MFIVDNTQCTRGFCDILIGAVFKKEYEGAIKKFGFSETEKQKPIAEFSGGQRTKIAFFGAHDETHSDQIKIDENNEFLLAATITYEYKI